MTESNYAGRARLAAAVKAARLAPIRGWSKERAAREAGVNVATWTRIEEAAGVRDEKLSAVEAVLGWEPGTALSLLEEPVDAPATREVPTEVPALRMVAAGWGELTPDQQDALESVILTMFSSLKGAKRTQ